MRIPWIILSIFIALCIGCDIYIYRALRQRFVDKRWSRIQLITAIILYAVLLTAVFLPIRNGANGMLLTIMWLLFSFVTVYLSKLIFVIIDILACIPCIFGKRRIRTVSAIATVMACIVFGSCWWGAFVNRFNINVTHVDVAHSDVPEVFDGYRIVQISDLHTGTFGNDNSFLESLVDSINSLHPDLVAFTGDIVNSRSDELVPHAETLSRIKDHDGIVSVLGNHDYGDYSNWPSEQEKNASRRQLKDLQESMGWRLLDNDNMIIRRKNDSIVIIGVGNIGDPPFHVYGSLAKAYPNISDASPKILLSHNPAHWEDSISGNSASNVFLTLSGHTHAMQVELNGVSPASLRYRHWGGLYSDSDSTHLLNVNIGAGTVGFPARIGADPEITLITLRHK